MEKTKFIEKWGGCITGSEMYANEDYLPDFESDLDALITQEKKGAYPDTEADGIVFCGKCGKMK